MSRILTILLLGVENLEKLAWVARISRDFCQEWANCVDFAQFAVNLYVPFSYVQNGKWLVNFAEFAKNCCFLIILGGVHGSFI